MRRRRATQGLVYNKLKHEIYILKQIVWKKSKVKNNNIPHAQNTITQFLIGIICLFFEWFQILCSWRLKVVGLQWRNAWLGCLNLQYTKCIIDLWYCPYKYRWNSFSLISLTSRSNWLTIFRVSTQRINEKNHQRWQAYDLVPQTHVLSP